MNCLDLIHKNNTGAVYALKSLGCETNTISRVQLQIGEVAILMDVEEMQNFLQVIESAKNKCKCEKCLTEGAYKIIKCDTLHAQVKIKGTKEVVKDLEELVLYVIYNDQMDNILWNNDITCH